MSQNDSLLEPLFFLTEDEKTILSGIRGRSLVELERSIAMSPTNALDVWRSFWPEVVGILTKIRLAVKLDDERIASISFQNHLDDTVLPVWTYIDTMLMMVPVSESGDISHLLATTPDFLSHLAHAYLATVVPVATPQNPSSESPLSTMEAFTRIGRVTNRLYLNLIETENDVEAENLLKSFISISPPTDSARHVTALCLVRAMHEVAYARSTPTENFDPSILEFVMFIFERLAAYDNDIYRASLKNGSIAVISRVTAFLTSQTQRFASDLFAFKARIFALRECLLYFCVCFQESHHWVNKALEEGILLSFVLCFSLIKKCDSFSPKIGSILEEPLILILQILWCYTKCYLSVETRIEKEVDRVDDLNMIEEDEGLWAAWAPKAHEMWCVLAVEANERTTRGLSDTFWDPKRPHSASACAYKQCRALSVKTPKACSSCRVPSYCSKGCQRSDWKSGHRDMCKKICSERQDGFPGPIPSLDKAYAAFTMKIIQVMNTKLVIEKLAEYLQNHPETRSSQQMHATLNYRTFPPEVTVEPYSPQAFPCKDPTANYICTVLVFGTACQYTRSMPWIWRNLVDGEFEGSKFFV
ncbi:hypothetical protein F5877DRAFT_75933 [Lentinula edodes]|nr:hypothetical protein F5877DRAFT_75933 [Lentinula edodes]